MNTSVARILDANANRAREALRVMEDYARFALNDGELSGVLKTLRHDLAAALAPLALQSAILQRDTPHDVGTQLSTPTELRRESLGEVVIAAGKRLSEALRSLEEFAKTVSPAAAQSLEQLRYRGYEVERALAVILGQAGASQRFAAVRLCVLLTEALCHPSAGGWEGMLEAVLGAVAGSAPGTLCIQLREKNLSDAELLGRAKIVAEKCRAAEALSIINDRPDIALLAGADGVHLGQTDLPCAAVRKLVGHDMIIGVSTENLDQARQALRDGASYIAAGPMFPTQTKEKPRLAGPEYAREAVAEIPFPIIAIGGITVENASQLTAVGVRAVAVCSAIIGQADAGLAASRFLKAMIN